MIRDGLVDVADLLVKCQIDNVDDLGEEVNFSCPFPGHSMGDQRPSAYMNARTTAWICHGCKRRGNAVTFVAELENVSPLKAARWLQEAYGDGFKEPEGGSMAREFTEFLAERERVVEALKPDPKLSDYAKSWFAVKWDQVAYALDYPNYEDQPPPSLSYPFERGLDLATLKEFEFGYDKIGDRLTFAVRNVEGELVGFKGRAADPEAVPKYRVLGDMPDKKPRYGFAPYHVSHHVYLLDRCKGPSAILCEGELNAVKLWQLGYEACGLGGSEVSAYHADLIASRLDHVTLLFDSDEAGLEGLSKAVDLLETRLHVDIVPLHDGDPMDMDASQVRDLLARRSSSLDRYVPQGFTP